MLTNARDRAAAPDRRAHLSGLALAAALWLSPTSVQAEPARLQLRLGSLPRAVAVTPSPSGSRSATPEAALLAALVQPLRRVLRRATPTVLSSRDRFGRPGSGLVVKLLLFRF